MFQNFKGDGGRYEGENIDILRHKIRNATFNTKRRILAGAEFDHAMSGSVTSSARGNACE